MGRRCQLRKRKEREKEKESGSAPVRLGVCMYVKWNEHNIEQSNREREKKRFFVKKKRGILCVIYDC
jgi:hypothetical protein